MEYRSKEWEITPWMRVYFPQKSVRSLACPGPAPATSSVPSSRARAARPSSGACCPSGGAMALLDFVCARAFVHPHLVPVLLPHSSKKENATAQLHPRLPKTRTRTRVHTRTHHHQTVNFIIRRCNFAHVAQNSKK